MKKNEKFGVAVHILTYLDIQCKGKLCTSAEMAESIQTNPVVVRRVLGELAKANLVSIKRGQGGATLKMDSQDIKLDTVYEMFSNDIFNLHPNPNEACPMGRVMNDTIKEVLDPAITALKTVLSHISLKDMSNQIKNNLKENE